MTTSTCTEQAVKIPQQAELVDEDAMSQIRKGHDTMCVVLTSRHKNLDTVRAVWTTGDIKASPSPPRVWADPRRKLARAGRGAGWALSLHGSFCLCFCHRRRHELLVIERLLTCLVSHSSAELQACYQPPTKPLRLCPGRACALPVPSDRHCLFAQTSVDSAVAINDLSVVVDLLNIVNQKA